ncbi:hypothetical protein GGH16_004612, partial [Coemansia sp. RSA 560]
LKTRKPGQGGDDEFTAEELRQELEAAERRHFAAKTTGGSSPQHTAKRLDEEKARYIEMAQRLDAESDTSSVSDDSAESNSDDSESESEDETAMLMRELEKIKRERAEEKARDEQESLERRLLDDSSQGGNPLLAQHDFLVKRRWDDDVVFKNQARGDSKPKKRFVNDMLRSDFHNKFMRKYIQ